MNTRLIALLLLPGLTASAQRRVDPGPFDPGMTRGSLIITVGKGGASSAWFQNLYDHGKPANETGAELGGWAASLGVLRGSGRIRFGGELGVFVIGPGELRDISWGPYICTGACAGNPTDDTGIHVGALSEVDLFRTRRILGRIEAGSGVVFFNLNPAGPAERKNNSIQFVDGTPYYDEKPGPEPYVALRFAPAIILLGEGGTAITLNPFASILTTFGETKTRSTLFGASFGIRIGGAPR